MTVKLRSGQRPGDTDGYGARPPPGRRGRRQRDRVPPAQRRGAPQGRARLRPGREARRLARRAGDPHRRPAHAEEIRAAHEHTGAAAVMLARGALGNPWLFEQAPGPARARRPAATRSSTSSTGSWTAPSSTSAPTAPVATCASSTPGTPTASRPRKEVQAALQQSLAGGAEARRRAGRARVPSLKRPEPALYCPAPSSASAARIPRRVRGFSSARGSPNRTRANPCPRTSSSPPKASRSSRRSSRTCRP